MGRALIIVDVQNDFCEGGALAVTGGAAVAEAISTMVTAAASAAGVAGREGFGAVVATQDWHIAPGTHFSDSPDFDSSWPVHCVAGTAGAELHPGLAPIRGCLDALVRKGRYEAAYSGFEGRALSPETTAAPEPGPDDALPGESLTDWLRSRELNELTVVGIATDFCVRATVLDALREGFSVTVLPELTAAVHPENTPAVLEELRAAGAEIA